MLQDVVNKLQPEETELWALNTLETMLDAVRFRVDGLRPDLLQERPAGFSLTMVDIISSLRQSEQALAAGLTLALKEANPLVRTSFSAFTRQYVVNPFDELGDFLNARELSLAVIRRLGVKDWERTINDPDLGSRTLRQIILERARNDLTQLKALENLRMALLSSTRPGMRTLYGSDLPDSTR
ncbi:MAG: hypothetical protein H0T53_08825 [Herpetosiphonaceae bacterium]|nr:hypothetical protein [Herpetosiphonaceae bacterium]